MQEHNREPALRQCPDENGRCTLELPSYDAIAHAPNCDCKTRSETVYRLLGRMFYEAILSQQALETQRQAWDRSAHAWRKWDGFLTEWLRPIGESILAAASLKDDHRILEVGCGTGELGLMAASEVAKGEVVAVDFSEKMIEAARQKAQSLTVKNYTARAAEISALPFDEDTFDVVVGRHVVMLLQNRAWSMKQLARVLKPRGRLVLSSWGPMERNPWMTVGVRAIEGVLGRDVPMSDGADGPGPFQCSEQKTLTSLFTKADVTNKLEVSEVSGDLAFESPEHYWRFLSQVVGRVASALKGEWKNRRQEIRRAVVRAAKGHVRDGSLTLGWSALVASGAKPRKRPYSIRLEVEFADCTGKVWHRHESVYPKPQTSDAPTGKPTSGDR